MIELRPAIAADLAAMRDVAVRAGEGFRAVADERVARCADDPAYELAELEGWRAAGRATVAVEGDGQVVGFALVDLVDGHAHLEEIDVDPAAQGLGIGALLLDHVVGAATAAGRAPVTLTTFADVPWNRPWYERHGFVVLADDDPGFGPELRRRVVEEAAHGLDTAIRVVMARPG